MNLELLSPAKNLECGIAAIHHGADAVYIGAPRFGAREAVGNSTGDIEKLAAEAHRFNAKTYVALNTILYDDELDEAEKIIRQVYEAGADALIIQDMGILEMNLPPIPLHASTQANNFTGDKIDFLEKVGFKRAVLARELSLHQIKAIADQTSIELEAFVHGSLCVSLSGQCFMSHSLGGRSANRGACAQPCRKQYTLKDASGKIIVQNRHLLSLKDLNRSHSLNEMIDAGVRSFKIEGRLKDLDYVKNITAFYRREIDAILLQRGEFKAASAGKTTFTFTPDPAKTFHRGSTEYYLRERTDPVAQPESAKSQGEEMGEVIRVARDYIELSGTKKIANNDGLTFVSKSGESIGLKVNQAENGKIYPDKMNFVYTGAKIFRNYDHDFQKSIGRRTSERKIGIHLELRETEKGFLLLSRDETGRNSSCVLEMEKIPANDPVKSKENIVRQLTKSGDTIFVVTSTEINGNEKYFFTSQQINSLRREVLEKTDKEKFLPPAVNSSVEVQSAIPFPTDDLGFQNNISNRLALQFYRKHGINQPELAVEKSPKTDRLQVMITRHCLKYELNFCTRFGGTLPNSLTEPFFLMDGQNHFELEFDCRNCRMKIFHALI